MLAASKASYATVMISASERSLLSSKIMKSSTYHSLLVKFGIMEVHQQNVDCLLLNSTCLAVLQHELALHAEVHVTATCEHGTSRCTLCTATHWHAV